MINSCPPELETIRDFVRFGVTSLTQAKVHYGHGTDNALDEMVSLLSFSLNLPHDNFEVFLECKLIGTERKNVFSLIERRITERKPLPYLTKQAWLGDYKFYIDDRAIIPRSYIGEFLIEGVGKWLPPLPNCPSRVLDLCTGSGCLAIIAADLFPTAKVEATDISPEALKIAQLNITKYKLSQRIKLFQSDLFGKIDNINYFDLIISNPPYVTQKSMKTLPLEYKHEPTIALSSGRNGLNHIKKILHQAGRYLTSKGQLIVECGHNKGALENAFPSVPFTWIMTKTSTSSVFLLSKEDLDITNFPDNNV